MLMIPFGHYIRFLFIAWPEALSADSRHRPFFEGLER